jgi:hypothetical protein
MSTIGGNSFVHSTWQDVSNDFISNVTDKLHAKGICVLPNDQTKPRYASAHLSHSYYTGKENAESSEMEFIYEDRMEDDLVAIANVIYQKAIDVQQQQEQNQLLPVYGILITENEVIGFPGPVRCYHVEIRV